jgi:hypothetical protein
VNTGAGELKFSGYCGEVVYEITGKLKNLAATHSPLRGLVRTLPETAAALFKSGEGTLKLDNGRNCRIRMLGYSNGSDTAYFEISAA